MVTQIASSTSASTFTLAVGDELVVVDGVQIWRDASTVVTASGSNQIFIGAGAAVLAFDPSFGVAVQLQNATTQRSQIDIAAGGALQATGYAIDVQGGLGSIIINNGSVSSRDFAAIRLNGGDEDRVVNTGTLSGDISAINIFTAGRIDNFGVASGEAYGIRAVGGGAAIVNTGEIIGASAVGLIGQFATLAHELINSGRLQGRVHAVQSDDQAAVIVNTGVFASASAGDAAVAHANNDADRVYRLTNSGDILSAGLAYDGSLATDLIENIGRILGRIDLGGGADLYLGRDGLVEGAVYGGGGADQLIGGAGQDELFGGAQNDVLRGGAGDDVLRGGEDDDQIGGQGGADQLFGDAGRDLLRGHAGDDSLSGGAGDDDLRGAGGDDALLGEDGVDVLRAGAGDDEAFGGAGGDDIRGHAGDDVIGGGRGADLILGGRGDDTLTGGQFTDTFVMKRRNDDDVVTDFENGTDVIDLQAFGLRPAQYAAVVAPALTNAGGGATFLDLAALGGQGSVLIQGLAFADADASDFIL
ncbi:MAG: hypothetical protein AAF192_12990 [Pseudomonadota bacterium]